MRTRNYKHTTYTMEYVEPSSFYYAYTITDADTGTVFYVGSGQKERFFDHILHTFNPTLWTLSDNVKRKIATIENNIVNHSQLKYNIYPTPNMQYARILEHLLIEQHGAKVPKQYMGVKNFWKHELTDKNQYISGLMQHNEQIVVKFYQK